MKQTWHSRGTAYAAASAVLHRGLLGPASDTGEAASICSILAEHVKYICITGAVHWLREVCSQLVTSSELGQQQKELAAKRCTIGRKQPKERTIYSIHRFK